MTPGSARDDTSSAGRHTSNAASDKLVRSDEKPETRLSALMVRLSWVVVPVVKQLVLRQPVLIQPVLLALR